MLFEPARRSAHPPLSIVESTSAAARLKAAETFVRQRAAGTEIVVVGASRQAADDFVRELAVAGAGGRSRATFGLHRFSLLQLAAFAAIPDLTAAGLAPASALGVHAITTRAAFDARREHALVYMSPIAGRPGFPAALFDTVADLRAAGVSAANIPASDSCLADIAALLSRFETQLESFHIADTAALLRVATAAVREGRVSLVARAPLLLLDVPVETDASFEFVSALAAVAPHTFMTVVGSDSPTLERLGTLEHVAHVQLDAPARATAPELDRVQSRLFRLDVTEPAPVASGDGIAEVELFSAPGEGREAIEIARRVVDEARRGTRFDRMAVLARAPQVYGGLLETAFRRAGIPAWFARGTRRPDPSGRAFLALLLCALERLSARRFAEYLSLGKVPDVKLVPGPIFAAAPWVPAEDELFRRPAEIRAPEPREESDAVRSSTGSDRTERQGDVESDAVVAGTLQAPWRWEDLLVEAAVIGSRDRWQRRLDGLARDLEERGRAIEVDDPDSPRAHAIRRDVRHLGHLRAFAMPIIDRLASLPAHADWGTWLDHLSSLAPMALRQPDRVLAVLAELRPMSRVGPVTLEEVHRVLAMHLSQLRQEPAAYRFGAVLVATPEQARGRTFDVVFVPGLAERVFPQRAREDPLLVDERRRHVAARLPLREDVAQKERLLLRLAAGAASRRLCLSYPSMELAQARARVPSFYALDVERARTGRVPDFEVLAARAQQSGGARLAWPAPADPRAAIDDGERDLSVLAVLLQLQQRDRAAAKGRARFLLGLNPHLARALRARWARAQRPWSAADGLYNPGAEAKAMLAAYRLRARPYSVSALQRFAACPYQFLLGAIHRLEPRDEITWLEQLDPLQRGGMFHEVQAEAARALLIGKALARSLGDRDAAVAALDRLLDRIAGEYYEQLAPAIDRVWRSEVESLRTDLHGWLLRTLDAASEWQPCHAELGFGFGPGDGRDPASLPSPITLAGGWQLHGIADLVERRAGGDTLRVTDHKTGRARTNEDVVVGGGEALQPVLYAMALEIALGRPVEAGRLFYCTLAGGYAERVVMLDAQARRRGVEVLEIIDRAVEQGSLPPAPRERACEWCDFRAVCGPDEERRIARKDPRPLADLGCLRGLK